MLRRFLTATPLFVAMIALSGVVLSTPVQAQTKSAFTDAQRAELNTLIKEYIAANPSVLIDSVEKHYESQTENQAKQEGPLEEFPAGLLDNPNTPFVGPKDAKVVMVEFFDYNCGYCKQVANDVARLHREEKDIKIMFKELPILSETSELAARWALAANKQNRYMDFHMALMSHQGGMNETILESTAKSLNMDVKKLRDDAESQEVGDLLAKNVEIARQLGVRGTPFFLIGKEKIPGAINFIRMREAYKRQGGDTSDATPTAAAVAPAVKPAAAPAAVAPSVPATAREAALDAELKKAQDETKAMIQDIKKQAEDMQKAAAEAQKAAAEAEKAKE